MASIFSDQKAIYGALKAASKGDADVLYTTKQSMLATSGFINIISWGLIGFGAFMCITILGIPIGIIMFVGAWYIRKKNKQFKASLNTAYTSYENELKELNS
jgi:hypothetical protein